MLAALLPGLRDLRAPLASGYLWLAFVWACFNSQLENAVQTNHPLHKLLAESGVLGSTRLLAILTFAAFLIGAVLNVSSRGFINLVIWFWDPVWEATIGKLLAPLHRVLERRRSGVRRAAVPSDASTDTCTTNSPASSGDTATRTPEPEPTGLVRGLHVSTVAHRHLVTFLEGRRGNATGRTNLDDPRLRREVLPVYDEIPQLAIRLAKDQPTLFDAYDRAHAEADFRVTVAVPLAALGIRLMWVWWPVGLLLLAETPFMLSAAVTKERAANDVVIEAVCIGAVESEAVHKLVGRARRTRYRGTKSSVGMPMHAGET